MQLPVHNIKGEVVGKAEASDVVFGAPENPDLVHQALVYYQANQRQGSSNTLTRAFVSGGGRKPFAQKGTGRARVGSIRSPIWRGGGIVFGPSPRDYTQRTPKRMRWAALKASLSSRARDGELLVVDKLNLAEAKTKYIVSALASLNVTGTVLLVADGAEPEVLRAAKNVPKLKMMPAFQLNTVDLLKHRRIIMTVDAVREAERIWGGPFVRKGKRAAPAAADKGTPDNGAGDNDAAKDEG